MKEIVELSKELLGEIDEMTELFYQNKEQEGLFMLNGFIGKMENLLAKITVFQKENNRKIVEEEKLLGSVGEAFGAMQEKDNVLLADLFQYDIKEQLEQILENCQLN